MPAIAVLPPPAPRTALVQIDPRYVRAEVRSGPAAAERLPAGAARVNASYFTWEGSGRRAVVVPLGLFQDARGPQRRTPLAQTRALFLLSARGPEILVLPPSALERAERAGAFRSALAIQGGPLLVLDGNAVDFREQYRRERIPSDIRRRTFRSALGITPAGKLLLLHAADRTLPETAVLLARAGADRALNLDGGSSASLAWSLPGARGARGAPAPRTALLFLLPEVPAWLPPVPSSSSPPPAFSGSRPRQTAPSRSGPPRRLRRRSSG